MDNDHVPVRVTGTEGKITFYLNYLQKNEERLLPVIENIKNIWPEEKLIKRYR